MGKPLNKREREYIKPAVIYDWEIHLWPGRKDGVWDGDKILPVKVGAMAESLIKRGYLERLGSVIRATEKTKALKCRTGNCLYGRLYDDNDVDSGECPDCDGGMMFEGANQ
ncbi:hypothetical protein AB9B86_10990 [Klebsiella michiganensis]|uniref:hypothetical protein n=1 Tax=Klebsiella michiganensis TaxID=1134687 RepID=UPI003513F89C